MLVHKPKYFFWKAIGVWLITLGVINLIDILDERAKVAYLLQPILHGLILFSLSLLANWLLIHQKVGWKPEVTILKALLLGIPIYLFVGFGLYTGSQQFHLDYNWQAAIAVGFAAGLFEEYFCRGLLLGLLLKAFSRHSKTSQIWLAVFVSSLLFGLSHVLNLTHQSMSDTILEIISASVGGVFYGAVYLRTGTILMAMLVHGLWDFIVTLIVSGQINTTQTAEGTARSILLSLIVLLISIFYLRKSKIRTIQLEKLT